jgi:hypothetical protein
MESLPAELKVFIAEKVVDGRARYNLLQVSKEWYGIVWPLISSRAPQIPTLIPILRTPTIEDIERLEEGQGYLEMQQSYGSVKHVHIQCLRVDFHCLVFVCPFCWTKYKKSGHPTARAKRKRHIHGSNASLHVGFRGVRIAHCDPKYMVYSYPSWWHSSSRVLFHLWVTPRTHCVKEAPLHSKSI